MFCFILFTYFITVVIAMLVLRVTVVNLLNEMLWFRCQGRRWTDHRVHLIMVHSLPICLLQHLGNRILMVLQLGILTNLVALFHTCQALASGLTVLLLRLGHNQIRQCRLTSRPGHFPRRISFHRMRPWCQAIRVRIKFLRECHKVLMARYHSSQSAVAVRIIGIMMLLLQANGRLNHSGLGHRILVSGHRLSRSNIWYACFISISDWCIWLSVSCYHAPYKTCEYVLSLLLKNLIWH